MAPLDDATYRAPDTQKAGHTEKAVYACTKRLFGSQDMPPADDLTPKKVAKEAILSPNTLHQCTREALAAGGVIPTKAKKMRKRTRKSDYASASQPPPSKMHKSANASSS